MEDKNLKILTHRRGFLGTLAAGAAAISAATIASPLTAAAEVARTATAYPEDADAWFAKMKGKHKIIYDVPVPNGIMPFAWSKVFLLTNAATGTPEKENNVVVVLRHDGIPFAFEDRIWEKYKFGELFNVHDMGGTTPSVRNFMYKAKPGTFQVPGLGPVDIGIDQLQESGAMFCVCDMAMTVYSAVKAGQIGGNPADVKKDWISGLLPGVQVVPSGVWAVGRAQEHGCAYCYAGGKEA
jgi:intracellular sulfur oxidation DsrE/DsrF family protein